MLEAQIFVQKRKWKQTTNWAVAHVVKWISQEHSLSLSLSLCLSRSRCIYLGEFRIELDVCEMWYLYEMGLQRSDCRFVISPLISINSLNGGVGPSRSLILNGFVSSYVNFTACGSSSYRFYGHTVTQGIASAKLRFAPMLSQHHYRLYQPGVKT